jgi:hypothetical protein
MALQQIRQRFSPLSEGTSNVVDKVKIGARRTRSIRWDERIRNFDADFLIVSNHTGMEGQK